MSERVKNVIEAPIAIFVLSTIDGFAGDSHCVPVRTLRGDGAREGTGGVIDGVEALREGPNLIKIGLELREQGLTLREGVRLLLQLESHPLCNTFQLRDSEF